MRTVGFLLGAGFSKALHPEMPVMRELRDMLEDAGKIPEYVPSSVRDDLERTLSYLWTNYPWLTETDVLRNRIDYLTLVRDLHKILSEREFSAWREIYAQGELSKDDWRGALAWMLSQADRSVVLTMNYDTLLERLMIAANQTNWLTYPAPIQRLYGAWNQQRDMAGTYVIGGASFMPSIYKLHGSLSWYSLSGLDENSIVYGLDMDHYYLRPQDPVPDNYSDSLFPVIVPPVADKASMYSNKVLRAQWIGTLNDLKQCNELYCVGYSFPKSDLAMQLFLAEASSKIDTVHLVNINEDVDIEDRVRNLVGSSTIVDGIYGTDCVAQMTQLLAEVGLAKGRFFGEWGNFRSN